MYIRKSNIRLIIGITIVLFIFASLFIVSFVQKSKNITDLVEAEAKYSKNLDDCFKEEVVSPESVGALDVKVSDEGKIVGFNLPVKASFAFKTLKTNLESKSWKYVNSGDDTKATFYKTEGIYTWLFLNCIDISSQTSVVITVD
ncbi:MAG: hypothetical protein Q4E88_04815 [Coriobacteriia bacterium]|nr:hypothetical protein [Coriobacteriia bacterium]